jgi:outer membrane biosynthesis protein TonB
MGVEKAELKKAVLEDMGVKADDRLDALTAELYRTDGGAKALKSAGEGLGRDVFARLRKELDEGKIDADQAKHVDRYINTCINFLTHLARRAAGQVPVMQGRVDEATEAVRRIKKDVDAEVAKIQAIQIAEAAGEIRATGGGGHEVVSSPSRGPQRRPVGVRPGGSLKAQRAAEGAAETQEGASEGEGLTPDAPAPPSEERAPPSEPTKPARKPKAVPKTAPKPSEEAPKKPAERKKAPAAKTPSETAAAKKAKRQAAAKASAEAKRKEQAKKAAKRRSPKR